jgi:streptogramin lyase
MAVVAAIVAVALVAAAALVVSLGHGSKHPATAASGTPSGGASTTGAPPGVPIRVDTVAKLDPSSGRVVADYPVGTNPQDIAFSGDAVWVINQDDVTISKIDASSGHVSTRGGIPSPCGLSPGPGGGVWVDSCDQNEIMLVNPDSFEIERTLHVPGPAKVVSAYGSLWAVSQRDSPDRSLLYRFTAAGHLQRRIPLGLESSQVVAAAGALWGNDFGDGTLWRVDPNSDRAQFISGWTGPDNVVAGEGSLWIGDSQTNPESVSEWDPAVRQTVGLVRGYDGAIVVTPDALWIQNSDRDTLVEVDPQTDQLLAEFQLGYSSDMVLGDGGLWISAGTD